MIRNRKILSAVLAIVVAVIAFIYGTVDVANKSLQFDLKKIGESIYEAHAKSGKWPMQIADLEGTEYLNMPYRRGILENGSFVIVWQQDLDPNPDANSGRILAYANSGLLSRLGKVWACRGDLRIVKIGNEEKQRLKAR